MATISHGGGWVKDAHEIHCYVTLANLVGILIRIEDKINPAELSVYDAEMLERIAGKIRKYYNMPKIED